MPLYPPHIPQELSLGLNQELCSGNLETNRLSSIMEIFKLPTPKMEASKDLSSPKLPFVAYNSRFVVETQHKRVYHLL
jgi:hypothetical protein